MSSPPASPESHEASVRAEFDRLFQEQQFEDVAALCDGFKDTFPRATWLRTFGAYAFFALGQTETAIALAAESLALGSDDVVALFVLGKAHGQLGNNAAAAHVLEKTLEKLPSHADVAAALLEQVAAAYGMTTAKHLFERLSRSSDGPELAFMWARLRAEAGDPGLVEAPLLSGPAWAESRGVAFDWSDAPFSIPWREPAVVGELNRRRGEYPSYAPYVLTLPGATIFSKSNMVLTADGAVLNDTAADAEYGEYAKLSGDPAVIEREGDRVVLDVGQYEIDDIDACLHMSGFASEHFGHWTSEYLARLNYLRHHPRFASLPMVVDEEMPPQHLEYLRLVADNPIVVLPPGRGLRCKELVVVAPVGFFPVLLRQDHDIPPYRIGPSSAEAYEYLRERVAAKIPPPARSDRRVYISRRNSIWRRLNNEEEVSAHMAAQGFEIVCTEDLSFAEQVKLFQETSVLVAPNGSALMNNVFSPPGARVVVLSQRGVFNWSLYYAWAVNRGLDVIFVCGAEDTGRKHDNYAINLADLDLALAGA